MKKYFAAFIFVALSIAASSQDELYMPLNVRQAFEKKTRSMDGKPGPDYWQNTGDYALKISFDPKSRLLKGTETIAYSNNSPDTLKKIIFHLFPDFYKKGYMRNYPVDEADESEGVTIDRFMMGNEVIDLTNNRMSAMSGINLNIFPSNPVLPKGKATFTIEWHYTVNKGSHVRTGAVDSTSYFSPYTFPRIAVYDDIDGWDTWSHLGLQEFYNDWGNFDAEITVPRNFVVWATGELQNASAVFSKKIYDRYQQALSADHVTHIIDSTDYKNGLITSDSPFLTWKYSAKDVTDFAFALSDHFLWDGSAVVADKSSGRKVFVDAAYDKNAWDFFEVASVARRSVEIMCNQYPGVPFPFPHETVFNGLDQMEYPMMVNDNASESRKDMVQLTSHEVFHAYFPFYMGTNETKYAWMDEGWATIGESVISPMLGEPEDDGIYMRKKYEEIAGTDDELPMITNSQTLTGATYYTNSYGKPGIFYWTLQNLLGDEVYFKCLHAYMDRWHGKHPIPYDFFNTFNNVSGQNLDWFFKPWFFEQGYPDLGIKELKKISSRSGKEKWQVTISKKGIYLCLFI
jgi:hypothetical protein